MAENATRLVSDYSDGYYRISNGERYLNAASNTSITLNSTRTGSNRQFWHLTNNKLLSEFNNSYGLAGTDNAILSSNPVDIAIRFDSPNTCYIRKANEEKYLNISSGSLVWSTSKQYWTIEVIYKQTGVPVCNPEYFSSKSGMTTGTWDSTKTTNLKKFFAKLYHVNENNVTNNNIGQCMFGAVYSADYLNNYFKGRFHTGLDFTTGGGSTVYCPFIGKYNGRDNGNGCVYIYNANLNCTFVFMHLAIDSNLGSTIKVGDDVNTTTVLGVESNVSSVTNNLAKHLHIEVWSGQIADYASLPIYSYENFETISPYDKIAAVV